MGSDQLTLATLWSGAESELVTTRPTIALRHDISPFKVCADITIVIALESTLRGQLLPKDAPPPFTSRPRLHFIALPMCGGETGNSNM